MPLVAFYNHKNPYKWKGDLSLMVPDILVFLEAGKSQVHCQPGQLNDFGGIPFQK